MQIYVALNLSVPTLWRILISPENSSIGNQNLNPSNLSNKETDCFTEPKSFHFKNQKNLIMGYLSINSLRSKFESIKPIISPNFDIFLVLETKLDESFPNNQFSLSGYRMLRQDRNCFGGGLCIYVKENITFKQLNLHLDKETKAIYLEINMRLPRQFLVFRKFVERSFQIPRQLFIQVPQPKQFLVFGKYVEKSFKISRQL